MVHALLHANCDGGNATSESGLESPAVLHVTQLSSRSPAPEDPCCGCPAIDWDACMYMFCLQQRRNEQLAAWRAECGAVKQRREAALAARTKAEADYNSARTQQEAERAERAMKEAAAVLKV